VRRANELKMSPESSLLNDEPYSLSEYGSRVAIALRQRQDQFLPYILASNYWRVEGNAGEAVKCLRSALKRAKRPEESSVALISLANVLSRSQRPEEAASVLREAAKSGATSAHFALGNVLASLMKLEE